MSQLNKLAWMMCVRSFLPVIFFCSWVSISHAAKYSIKSNINGNMVYNDNVSLKETDKQSSSAVSVSPDAQISIRDENWLASLNLNVRSTNYSKESLDRFEQNYSMNGNYLTESSTFGVGLGYDVMSTLNSQSSVFGLVNKQVDRTTARFSPQYTLQATERFSISVGYSAVDVSYDDIVGTNLVPYETSTPSLSLKYSTTERSKINVGFSSTDYARDDGKSGYDTFVTQLGLDYQFSETIMAKVNVGGSNRNIINEVTVPFTVFNNTLISQVTEVKSKSNSLIYGITVNQEIYRGKVDYYFNKSDSTSSFGGLTEVDSLGISASQKVSDRWRYSMTGSYNDTKNVGSTVASADRSVITIKPIITYMIGKDLHLDASYEYASIKYDSPTNDTRPESNKVYIGLTYGFPEYSTY